MGPEELVRALRTWWPILIASVLAGISCGAVASLCVTPVYAASTQLFVSAPPTTPSADLLQQGSDAAASKVRSYAAVATSDRVLDPVVNSLDLRESPRKLASQVSAVAPRGTVLLVITVTDEVPQRAAAIANAVADSLTTFIGELETPRGSSVSPIKIGVLNAAVAPDEPVAPETELYLVLGLLAGAWIGMSIVVYLGMHSKRVRSADDAQRVTDLTSIGSTASYPGDSSDPLVLLTRPHHPLSEAYRSLRTNLAFLGAGGNSRLIAITSTTRGEGKTVTAVNLAIALAHSGERVVLIDANLRQPRIADLFPTEGTSGLTDVLIGQVPLPDALRDTGVPGLKVMATGAIPPNPGEVLGSSRMGKLLSSLRTEFDYVLLDTASILGTADTAILSRVIDGVIVVVASRRVTDTRLRGAVQEIRDAGGLLLGVVTTMLPARQARRDRSAGSGSRSDSDRGSSPPGGRSIGALAAGTVHDGSPSIPERP